MRGTIPAVIAAVAIVFAVSSAGAEARPSPEQRLAKILDGRVAGEPSDCIFLPSIRSTRIVRDTAIVYDAGSTIWVNRPEIGASSLDDHDILVTRLYGSGSQLCSLDLVHLRDQSSLFYNGSVGLGKFVPYRKAANN